MTRFDTHFTAVVSGEKRGYCVSAFRSEYESVIEVGSGVVPIEADARAYREAVGRALCVVAQSAESVTRCVCGIGVRIK